MGILDYLTKFLQNQAVETILPAELPPDPDKASFFLDWRGNDIPVPLHAPEPPLVAMMTSLLRSRRNWIEVPDALARVDDLCRHALGHLGVGEAVRESLVRAGLVEIRCPGQPGLEQEATWAFPWEIVLAEATRTRREEMRATPGQHFQVVRHLDVGGAPGPMPAEAAAQAPNQLLVVTSGPGWIQAFYEFEQEQKLIVSSLAPQVRGAVLANPDLSQVRDFVQANRPDAIHLSGVDARQGTLILGDAIDVDGSVAEADNLSGVYFSSAAEPEIVSFANLAPALASHGPKLVTLNMYNSAVGAAHLVRSGAEAAIGFQDEIDDALAERFCASLYSNWKRASWDLATALEEAWRSVARDPAVRGSGIVFWSRRSLLRQPIPAAPGAALPSDAPKPAARRKQQGKRRPRRDEPAPAPIAPAAPTAEPAAELTAVEDAVIIPEEVKDPDAHIGVACQALSELNFSLLHNNQDIYSIFTIRRQKPGVYRGIRVDVRLAAGSEEAAYVQTLSLDSKDQLVELRGKVRLALTPRLGQVLAESMFGTISTKVSWGPHVLYEDTQRIELLPLDEWRFDTVSGRWLPSFVFPRDPAVRRIIEAAQRYLIALRDDSAAGFDGYQGFDPTGRTINECGEAVDAQVQAIWWALVNDFAPSYINPPPSFSAESQRLRSPSHVLDGRRGTCIDLALLLASCLEYIDIYPVVFLLKDHAFPGYWRSELSHRDRLSSASLSPVPTGALSGEGAISEAVPWMFGTAQFDELLNLVREGHLVPIESTLLTSRGGFEESISEGSQNLRNKSEFDSMFDIKRARTLVTPVPIWGHGS